MRPLPAERTGTLSPCFPDPTTPLHPGLDTMQAATEDRAGWCRCVVERVCLQDGTNQVHGQGEGQGQGQGRVSAVVVIMRTEST